MSDAASVHQGHIYDWLDLLGHRPRGAVRYEPLRDGKSGAYTFRIIVDDEVLILKVVSSGSHPFVIARGVREALFYSRLAGAVPLSTPEVVASYGPKVGTGHGGSSCVHDASEGRQSLSGEVATAAAGQVVSALLLRAYRSPEPVGSWDRSRFEDVARQMARLHAVYWDRVDEFRSSEWLRQPDSDLSPYYDSARSAWRGLWSQERLAPVFDPSVIQRIEHALDHVRTVLEDAEPSNTHHADLPLTLCHGDAHHENLLVREDGAWVWSDWQEIGIGYGPDDVSFFYQRASASGARADLEQMLRAYHEELERQTRKTVEFAAIRRRAGMYELMTRLFHWPMYLQQAGESTVRLQVSRVLELLADLDPES